MKISKSLKNITAKILFMFMLTLGLVAGVAVMLPIYNVTAQNSGTGGGTTADEEDDPSDYSFYNLSSAAASALCTAAGTDDVNVQWEKAFPNLPSSAAGGFLGFADERKGRFIQGLFQSLTSTSSASYTFKQMNSDAMTNGGNYCFLPYLAFGSALADAGVDDYGLGSETFNMSRFITGGLTMLLFMGSQVIVVVYKMILHILLMLNPFQLFALADVGNFKSGFTALDQSVSAFHTLKNVVSGWYTALYNMSAVVVTFIFTFFIIGIIFCRNRFRQWGAWRKFIIRVFFIFLGIPLIGGTYTSILKKMSTMLDDGNTAAVKIVASTFCDFEGFVMRNDIDDAMVLPKDIYVRVTNNHIRYNPDKMSIQNLCLSINEAVTGSTFTNAYTYTGTTTDSGIRTLVSDIQNSDGSMPDKNLTNWTLDMLGRYMSAKKIRSSDYETAWISKHWMPADKEALKKFIDYSDSVHDYTNAPAYTGWSRYTQDSDINPFCKKGQGNAIYQLSSDEDAVLISSGFELSPMSVYNYLNTRFSSSNAVVYSTERASSDAVRYLHYSVNLTGGGIYGFFLFATCAVLLGVYAVIGFFYSFGILMTNLMRGIRLIIAVPGAMLGSLEAIARVISYSVLMILEILANIMCYALFTDLMFSCSTAFLDVFMRFSSVVGINGTAEIMGILMSIFLIVFLVWFCIKAIKMRSVIVKGLEGAADRIIQKFILGDGRQPQDTPGMMPAVLGGASAGAITGMIAAGNGGGGARQVEIATQNLSKDGQRISDMFGGNGSAVADEQNYHDRKRQRSIERREKLQHLMSGGTQAAKGAGNVAAGAARVEAGDVGGAVQIQQGVAEAQSAQNELDEAGIKTANVMPGADNKIPDTTTMGQDNSISEKAANAAPAASDAGGSGSSGAGSGDTGKRSVSATAGAASVSSGGQNPSSMGNAGTAQTGNASGGGNERSVQQSAGANGSSNAAGSAGQPNQFRKPAAGASSSSRGSSSGTSSTGQNGVPNSGGGGRSGSGGGNVQTIAGQKTEVHQQDEVDVVVDTRVNYRQGSVTETGQKQADVRVQNQSINKTGYNNVNVDYQTDVNEHFDTPVFGDGTPDVSAPQGTTKTQHVKNRLNRVATTEVHTTDETVSETVDPKGPVNPNGFSKK